MAFYLQKITCKLEWLYYIVLYIVGLYYDAELEITIKTMSMTIKTTKVDKNYVLHM